MDLISLTEATKFDPLNDRNYFQWKYRMEMQLIQKGLWEVVSGEDARPDGPETSHDVKDWIKRNRLATAEIVLHVSNSQLSHTRKTQDAREMWDILRRVHEGTGWAHRIALQRKLFTAEFDPAETSMQSHLNAMEEIADKLVAMGIPISDELRIISLFASLPSEYDSIVTAIVTAIEVNDGGANFDLTLGFVTRLLLMEEARRIATKGESPSIKVINHTRATRSKRDPKDITCFNCQKKGHYKSDCPSSKPGVPETTRTILEDLPDVAY